MATPEIVETDAPARLDRLRWGRFHSLVVAALGITWVLDGLEVTLAGAVSGALKESPALRLTDAQVGASASAYLAGAVLGALLFGWLTDLLGRRKLFFITLGLYLVATAATAFAQDFAMFAVFRFLTGCGIGGEYVAINSAIQELIPARYRGRTDLAINGSFWLGAMLGSLGTLVLLAPGRFPPDVGWRLAFGIGAVLGAVVLVFRRSLPESPRWLMVHGRIAEAEEIVSAIEERAAAGAGRSHDRDAAVTAGASAPSGDVAPPRIRLHARHRAANLVDLAISLFKRYPRRAVLGLVLMSAQAFFYNAIFFTFALVLTTFFGVPFERTGLYILPFALSNFIGPLALGWLFDHWGRRRMIAGTYAISGLLLGGTALLFVNGGLTAFTLTAAFSAVFFFASCAASSAYLTVSESFPLEVRALAIAVFYALGTGLGGVAAPWVFGTLIGSGDPGAIAGGYAFGAALMLLAGLIAWWLAIAAERRPLEEVAPPLSGVEG
ncbi:MAG: MFS transporter [Gammaproteobacteria bacterium]